MFEYGVGGGGLYIKLEPGEVHKMNPDQSAVVVLDPFHAHRHHPCIFLRKTFSLFHNSTSTPNLQRTPKLRVFASTSTPTIPTNSPKYPSTPLLSDSTRTVSAIFSTVLSISRSLITKIQSISLKISETCANPTPEELGKIQALQQKLVWAVGPLFFAALRDRPSGYLNTPLTVVVAGMAKYPSLRFAMADAFQEKELRGEEKLGFDVRREFWQW